MPVFPHDIADLGLAPVVLNLTERIDEISDFNIDELRRHIALLSDRPDHNRHLRESALIIALTRDVDLHGWEPSMHERGLQVKHGQNRVVLGLPATCQAYLEGAVPQTA